MRAYAEPCQVHLTVCSYLAWLIIPHIVMTSVMLCTAPASQGTPGGCCDGPTHANWQKNQPAQILPTGKNHLGKFHQWWPPWTQEPFFVRTSLEPLPQFTNGQGPILSIDKPIWTHFILAIHKQTKPHFQSLSSDKPHTGGYSVWKSANLLGPTLSITKTCLDPPITLVNW